MILFGFFFFFSSRRRHTRSLCDWSSDVCSSDLSERAAARKPSNLSHVEAASLPLVGLTAWQALLELGGLERGKKVLIHGGSGGVGTFGLQLARHAGATVYTTASARNHELVTRLGADVAIDYRQQRFEDVAKDCDVV